MVVLVPTSRRRVSPVRSQYLGGIDSLNSKSWAFAVISLMLMGLSAWNEDPAMAKDSQSSRLTDYKLLQAGYGSTTSFLRHCFHKSLENEGCANLKCWILVCLGRESHASYDETIEAKYLAVNGGRITVAASCVICAFVSLEKIWR
jgi:hypothetical protein